MTRARTAGHAPSRAYFDRFGWRDVEHVHIPVQNARGVDYQRLYGGCSDRVLAYSHLYAAYDVTADDSGWILRMPSLLNSLIETRVEASKPFGAGADRAAFVSFAFSACATFVVALVVAICAVVRRCVALGAGEGDKGSRRAPSPGRDLVGSGTCNGVRACDRAAEARARAARPAASATPSSAHSSLRSFSDA